MTKSLKEAEHSVRTIFGEEFPGMNFDEWNLNINDQTAMNIVKNVGRASRIDVTKFIEELRPRG